MTHNYDLVVPFVTERLYSLRWHNLTLKDEERPTKLSRVEGSRGIRLDFDEPTPAAVKQGWATLEHNHMSYKTQQKVIEALAPDIADLIVNGDVESMDPLLKAMDGEMKLGTRFRDVYLTDIRYNLNWSPSRDVIEHTIFTTIKGIL